jgi:hypothetical protein
MVDSHKLPKEESIGAMSLPLEQLRNHLAAMPKGDVEAPNKVATLLSRCWSELIGETRGILAFQVPAYAKQFAWNSPLLKFEMKRHYGNLIRNDSWTVDVKAGSVRTASDALFDEILKSESAQTLAKDLGPVNLKSWLRIIAEVPPKWSQSRERTRDRANSLAKRCLKLATAVQNAEPPMLITSSEYAKWQRLSHALAGFAEMWKRAHGRLRGAPKIVDPRAGAICSFVQMVKDRTSREHYQEIADLLNDINDIPCYRQPRKTEWSAGNLKAMVYRSRKRVARF